MAKVIIDCTDKQAKSIADSFKNEKRLVIINRMLATDKAELIDKAFGSNIMVIYRDYAESIHLINKK